MRGGYDEAITALQSDSNVFQSSLNELRSKVKGLSAYPSLAKPNTLGAYGKNLNMQSAAGDDYRTFDYQEFAK